MQYAAQKESTDISRSNKFLDLYKATTSSIYVPLTQLAYIAKSLSNDDIKYEFQSYYSDDEFERIITYLLNSNRLFDFIKNKKTIQGSR